MPARKGSHEGVDEICAAIDRVLAEIDLDHVDSWSNGSVRPPERVQGPPARAPRPIVHPL